MLWLLAVGVVATASSGSVEPLNALLLAAARGGGDCCRGGGDCCRIAASALAIKEPSCAHWVLPHGVAQGIPPVGYGGTPIDSSFQGLYCVRELAARFSPDSVITDILTISAAAFSNCLFVQRFTCSPCQCATPSARGGSATAVAPPMIYVCACTLAPSTHSRPLQPRPNSACSLSMKLCRTCAWTPRRTGSRPRSASRPIYQSPVRTPHSTLPTRCPQVLWISSVMTIPSWITTLSNRCACLLRLHAICTTHRTLY